MKKNALLLLSVLFTGTLLISCGDKTKELAYANLTVEQNKTKMQDDGLATMDKLNGMSDLSGVYAMQDLSNLMSSSTLVGAPYAQAVTKFIAPIVGMNKDVKSLTSLRAGGFVVYGLINTLQENGGVYTYNPSTQSFTRVPSTTEITFNYPIGNSSTNNGKLSVKNIVVTASTLQGDEAELIKSLDVTLTKGTSTLLSVQLRATYDADETPTTMSTDMSFVEGYAFAQDLTRSNGAVSWSMAYTLNDANLLSANFKTLGNFTNDALNNTGSLDEDDWIDQVLDNANASVQLGNLKVTGVVDINKLKAAHDKAFPDGESGTEADANKLSGMFNQYITLVVMYAKEGTVIAKSNFFTKEYSDYYFNYQTYQYQEYTYYDASMQFVFKDGSAMDQSFFDQGFEDLQAAFDEMVAAFQTNYGS
jgi:hypothetical protein